MRLQQRPEPGFAGPDGSRLLETGHAFAQPLDRALVSDGSDGQRAEQREDRDVVLDEQRSAIEESVKNDRFALGSERDRDDRATALRPLFVTAALRIGIGARVGAG